MLARLRHDADRYRWYALAITTFTQAASAASTIAIGPVAPLIQKDFGVSRAEVGVAQSAIYMSATASVLFGGRAADRIGERLVLVVSGLVTGAAGLGAAVAGPFWTLVLAGFVLGIGTGVQNPAGSAAIMRWFPPVRRGLAMGIRQTGVPIGGVLAASVWPLAATLWGWRAAYALSGVMALVGAALVAIAYFDPARETGTESAPIRPLRDLVTDRRLAWLAVTYNAQISAQYTTTVYFVLFLHEALGFSLVLASALLALVTAVAIGGRIGWGVLSDSCFGGARRPVLVIVILLTFAGLVAAAALPSGASPWMAVALAILIGVSTFSWTSVYVTFTAELAGRASAASALAWVHVLGGIGSLASAPIFGFIVDRTGSYRVAWLAVAAVVIAGLVAALRVHEDRRVSP